MYTRESLAGIFGGEVRFRMRGCDDGERAAERGFHLSIKVVAGRGYEFDVLSIIPPLFERNMNTSGR